MSSEGIVQAILHHFQNFQVMHKILGTKISSHVHFNIRH
jgi:hypothetical protein